MEKEGFKISMPLIDDMELQRIDTFYNDIVDEYTKQLVKEKNQVIIQRLMKKLREENKELKQQLKEKENQQKEFIKLLEGMYFETEDNWWFVILNKYKEITGGKEC